MGQHADSFPGSEATGEDRERLLGIAQNVGQSLDVVVHQVQHVNDSPTSAVFVSMRTDNPDYYLTCTVDYSGYLTKEWISNAKLGLAAVRDYKGTERAVLVEIPETKGRALDKPFFTRYDQSPFVTSRDQILPEA